MEFQRQCRRFLNYRVLDENVFKKKIEQITAICTFKTSLKQQPGVVFNRIVVFDKNDRTIYIINESDDQIIKQLNVKTWDSYGVCCTNKLLNNFIYFTDFTNNQIRKFDENLNEIKCFSTPEDSPMNAPCGITINNEFDRIDVVDQKNHRVVSFDLKTEEYQSELKLYHEVFVKKVKRPNVELTLNENNNDIYHFANKKLINCWPFGITSKNERIFVTDWSRNFVYIYKNGILENKICGHKLFSRIRDILIDSLDSILVTDTYKKSIFIFDNRGLFLMETKLPLINDDESIFGICKIDNNKLIFATNSSIVVCNLN